jgi:hypothetical protein
MLETDIKAYERQNKLAERIGQKIVKRVEAMGLDLGKVAEIVAPQVGAAYSTTYFGINHAMHGYMSFYRPINPKYRKDAIRRLEVLLYTLNVSKNSALIKEIKKEFSYFSYPPKEIESEDKLEKTVSKLKPKDRKWVNNLVNRIISNYNS